MTLSDIGPVKEQRAAPTPFPGHQNEAGESLASGSYSFCGVLPGTGYLIKRPLYKRCGRKWTTVSLL